MNTILRYLQNYNKNIVNSTVSLDIFSVFTDPNIMIQDGPLACYCSHVRGMIYGFLNFTDYTLIVEDDFHVNDTELILKGIEMIPDDWDIICFGAQPINKFYSGNFYKFTDLFHSTQFYIIRNNCMETIFKNIYPISDQIDILLSKMHSILNIYNIPHSVLQKNFTSNTQNNLYVMYNSPNYQYIRITLDKIKTMLKEIIVSKFNTNRLIYHFIKHIDNIVLKMLYDFIFSKIVLADDLDEKYFNEEINVEEINVEEINVKEINVENDNKTNLYHEYFIQNEKNKLYSLIYIIINSCVKGINVDITVKNIISDIFDIINNFETISLNTHMELFPLNYGSTSNVYLGIPKDNDDIKLYKNIVVVKAYSKKLRFKYVNNSINHSNLQDIIQNEILLLKRLQGFDYFPQLINNNSNEIHLTYTGETLFDNFNIPSDYKEQIIAIFEILNSNNIYYPEFNLKNITCLDGRIYFIDFGLASNINDIQEMNNNANKQYFIELLDLLNNKYKEITDIEQQHIYYNNLVVNVKLNSDSKYKNNIF
jgi:tRNA A-37 threonylcarbamoyl transferase component Bud32